MSTFDDLSSDAGKLRAFLNDRDANAAFFTDDDLANLILEANGFVVPVVPTIGASRLYWAAYQGWLIKAGKRADESKKQKIAIIQKDTHVTFLDTMVIAEKYKAQSLSAALSTAVGASVIVPLLDTLSPRIDTSDGWLYVPDSFSEAW